jgi:hypothetical protein
MPISKKQSLFSNGTMPHHMNAAMRTTEVSSVEFLTKLRSLDFSVGDCAF